jgi:hypothetical protein
LSGLVFEVLAFEVVVFEVLAVTAVVVNGGSIGDSIGDSRAGVAGDVVTVGVSFNSNDFCGPRNDSDESGGGDSLILSIN